jgi:hypothetical protein
MGIGAGYIISRETEKIWNEILAKRQQQVFVGHRESYIKLLHTDYRYHEILFAYENGLFSLDQALILVEHYRQTTLTYHDFMNEGYYMYADETDAQVELLSSPDVGHLFKDIKALALDGIQDSPDLDTSYRDKQYGEKTNRLSDKEINELMRMRHHRLLADAIIPELVKGTALYDTMKNDPVMADALKIIHDNSFARALFESHKDKAITDDELIYLLTEDVYRQFEFMQWQVLGLAPMFNDENGVRRIQRLEDARKITWRSIKARVNAMNNEGKNIGELPICPASPVIVKP